MFKTRITQKQVDEFLERKKAEVTKPKTVKKGVSKSLSSGSNDR